MALCIKLKSGPCWYSNASIDEVRGAIDRGESLEVWWFMPWGQRYRETVWVAVDELSYLMTERDDG